MSWPGGEESMDGAGGVLEHTAQGIVNILHYMARKWDQLVATKVFNRAQKHTPQKK